MTNKSLTIGSALEGIRLVIGGIFCTGRDAAGSLTFGFSPVNLGNMVNCPADPDRHFDERSREYNERGDR